VCLVCSIIWGGKQRETKLATIEGEATNNTEKFIQNACEFD